MPDLDQIRQMMLVGGGGFDMGAPTAGVNIQQPDQPQHPQEQDPLLQMPWKPQQGVLPAAAREPGLFKRMLMNFTHQMGDSLLAQSGLETSTQRRDREFTERQTLRQQAQQEKYQSAQMANLTADNARQQAEQEAKKAAEEAKRIPVAAREEFIRANNLPPQVAAAVRTNGLVPTWYKPETSDKSLSELEGLVQVYGKTKGLDEYDRRLKARAAAGRSTTSVGLPDTAATTGPLKNSSEEKFAQMRAQGKLTDQQINSMYPGKAGMASKQRINIRAAELSQGGNLNTPLSPAAQKDIRSAETALDNVRELKGIIEKAGLTEHDSQIDPQKWKEYFRYKGGMGNAGDYPKAFARMSLGSLREATAVLAGSSRAWAALHRALEHTPSMAYTPKGNYQRLHEIEIALQDVIRESNQYGTKSGLVTRQPDATATPETAAPPAAGGWDTIMKKSKPIGRR